MAPRKKTPVKRTSAKRKAVPKKKIKLEQWHKTMIAILATAAVFGLGGKMISGVKNTAASIDDHWTRSDKFDKATSALVDTDIKLDEKIKLVGQRLDLKITQDKVDWRQKRMNQLMAQYGSFQKMPELARAEYLKLQNEINDLRAGKFISF
jgi:hypothetical protein